MRSWRGSLRNLNWRCNITNNLQKEVESICDILKLDASKASVKYVDADTPSMYVENGIYIIEIVPVEHWNDIYQLSHELMHATFHDASGDNKPDIRWIEEIICEAFSIFCLCKFAKAEYNKWFGYLHPQFYIKNENISACTINPSLTELNELLTGCKSYQTRQFIQPLVVSLQNTMRKDISALHEILNTNEYTNGGRLFIPKSHSKNEILIQLSLFQDKILKRR